MAPLPLKWYDPTWAPSSLYTQMPLNSAQPVQLYIPSSPLYNACTDNLVGNWRTVNWELVGSSHSSCPHLCKFSCLLLIHFSCPSCNTTISHDDPTQRIIDTTKEETCCHHGQLQGQKRSSSWEPVFCFGCAPERTRCFHLEKMRGILALLSQGRGGLRWRFDLICPFDRPSLPKQLRSCGRSHEMCHPDFYSRKNLLF